MIKNKCLLKKRILVQKSRWTNAKSEGGVRNSIGVLYKKPVCKEGYILKPFSFNNYIKLRCRKIIFNKSKKKFKFFWRDPESSRNGRILLSKLQGEPYCFDGWRLKIFNSNNISKYRCVQDNETGAKIWRNVKYRNLSDKKKRLLGMGISFKFLPDCPDGYKMRDFDMGNWIKVRCFKKQKIWRKVCVERVFLKEINMHGKGNKVNKGVKRKRKFRLKMFTCRAKSTFVDKEKKCVEKKIKNGKKVCKKSVFLSSVNFCLRREIFKARPECVEWKRFSQKLRCEKGEGKEKKLCVKKKVLKPRSFCKKIFYFDDGGKDKFKSYCMEKGVFYGRKKVRSLGCVDWDGEGRCVHFELKKKKLN